jgi:hypothetical protein
MEDNTERNSRGLKDEGLLFFIYKDDDGYFFHHL